MKKNKEVITEQESILNDLDIKNLLILLNKTPIVGGEAETVSVLKYKLSTMIKEVEPTKDK